MGIWNWFSGMIDGDDEEGVETEAGADGDPGTADDALEIDGFGEPGEADDGLDGGDGGPDLVEIEHQVGELEEEMERNESRIESVQHSQEEVSERVDEMNETVRDLLGVYERLTDDVNPFTAEGAAGRDGTFGVVGTSDGGGRANGNGDEEDGAAEADWFAGASGEVATADAEGPGVEDEDGGVVTFEDVLAGADESAEADATPAVAPDDGSGADEGRAPPANGPGAADASTPAAGDAASNGRDGTAGGAPGTDEEWTPYLAALADGYATDVIVFEWLGELVEAAGPSAALKAVSYYEDVGWIAPAVASELEEYLSGPGIDVCVDPNEPDDLTAEDHATSYEYILKLDAVGELERTA
jgi:archaellum component FlaD/FlaE